MKSSKKRPSKQEPSKTKPSKQKSPAKTAAKAAVRPRRKASARSRATAKRPASPRADYGAPVDGFFAKQPSGIRPILEALRELVAQAAPDAEVATKWGMPFYSIGGVMMCALGAHKSHVNLILSGPPGTFADPGGRLSGQAKTGRHLKLTTLAELRA